MPQQKLQKKKPRKAKSSSYPPFLWRALPEKYIIGVDEVGRGCLAGRVFAAAVVLNPEHNDVHFVDSKSITAKKRKELATEIHAQHRVSIASASLEEIDTMNILHASLLAMERAVLGLGFEKADFPDCHLLVDGSQSIKTLKDIKQTLLVKGDFRATPIGAASIVAKVARDNELIDLARAFPHYGFEKHKGYGTAEHKKAIAEHGPTKHHRKSFAGVREYL